jgi:hypothetical protein
MASKRRGERIFLRTLCTSSSGIVLDFAARSTASGSGVSNAFPSTESKGLPILCQSISEFAGSSSLCIPTAAVRLGTDKVLTETDQCRSLEPASTFVRQAHNLKVIGSNPAADAAVTLPAGRLVSPEPSPMNLAADKLPLTLM